MNKYTLNSLEVGPLGVNCYILSDAVSKDTVIIDPGGEPQSIIKEISNNSLKPLFILNTHGHIDHTGANKYLKGFYKIGIYIHKADAGYLTESSLNGSTYLGCKDDPEKADMLLEDNQKIKLGNLELKIIHTPGHTPGGICVLVEDLLFTGDTLFLGSIGRWDFDGGDKETIIRSLEVFKKLDPSLKVLPGHGPSSTIKEELQTNPYLTNSF